MNGSFKYPVADAANALVVEPLTTAGPQPWHARALEMRRNGMFVREIAKNLGVGFGPVQRFLNPDSKRRQKEQQAEYERQRRANDPQYAEKTRHYVRRYMQHWHGRLPHAPGGGDA